MISMKKESDMDALQFCYWLQGFAEINGESPNETQWKAIRSHLNGVLEKKTYSYPTYRDATSIKPDNNWTVRAMNQKPKEEPDAYL